jgi:hypothetical protein
MVNEELNSILTQHHWDMEMAKRKSEPEEVKKKKLAELEKKVNDKAFNILMAYGERSTVRFDIRRYATKKISTVLPDSSNVNLQLIGTYDPENRGDGPTKWLDRVYCTESIAAAPVENSILFEFPKWSCEDVPTMEGLHKISVVLDAFEEAYAK